MKDSIAVVVVDWVKIESYVWMIGINFLETDVFLSIRATELLSQMIWNLKVVYEITSRLRVTKSNFLITTFSSKRVQAPSLRS